MLQVQVVCPQPQEQLWPGVQFAQQPFFAQEQQPTMANARPTAATSIMTLFIFDSFLPQDPFPTDVRIIADSPLRSVIAV